MRKLISLLLILSCFAGCCHFDRNEIPGLYSCHSDKGYEEIVINEDSTFVYFARDNNDNVFLDSGRWGIETYIDNCVRIDSIKDFLLINGDCNTDKEDGGIRGRLIDKNQTWHWECDILTRRVDQPYDFIRADELYYLSVQSSE